MLILLAKTELAERSCIGQDEFSLQIGVFLFAGRLTWPIDFLSEKRPLAFSFFDKSTEIVETDAY